VKRALLLVVAVMTAFAMHGCGPRPGVRTPIDDGELADLAGRVAWPGPGEPTIRATGTGQMVVSGRTLRFGFALLQSGASWLRIDLRPELLGYGAGLNALVLIEGACARAYFPARVIEVRGCFDEIFGFPGVQGAASLATGFPDSVLVASLEGAAIARVGDELSLTGRLLETPVELLVDPADGLVGRIVAGDPDAFDEVTIEYGDRGWKDALPCPRIISVVAREGTSREARVRLEFETFREAASIERDQHGLPTPPGARILSWDDVFGRRD